MYSVFFRPCRVSWMLLIGCLWGADPVLAQQTPQSLLTDPGIKVVNFVPHNVVNIVGKPFFVTTIQFGENEVIDTKSVINGSGAAWMAQTYQSKPNYLALKPTVEHSNTNLTVVTNRHTYYFHLRVDDRSTPTYGVIFHYPQEARAAQTQQQRQDQALVTPYRSPDAYNWDYTFNGDRTIMPVRVFDDGTFTYLKFMANEPQPAIFAVDNARGDEAVVNTRRKGQWLVVERVSPQFTLRLGQHHVASIFNHPYIQAIADQTPYFTAPVFSSHPERYHPRAENYVKASKDTPSPAHPQSVSAVKHKHPSEGQHG